MESSRHRTGNRRLNGSPAGAVSPDTEPTETRDARGRAWRARAGSPLPAVDHSPPSGGSVITLENTNATSISGTASSRGEVRGTQILPVPATPPAVAVFLIVTLYRPTTTSAQVGTFVVVGGHLALEYGENGGSRSCIVADVRGNFVRCEAEKPNPFRTGPEYERWLNLGTAIAVNRAIERK